MEIGEADRLRCEESLDQARAEVLALRTDLAHEREGRQAAVAALMNEAATAGVAASQERDEMRRLLEEERAANRKQQVQ